MDVTEEEIENLTTYANSKTKGSGISPEDLIGDTLEVAFKKDGAGIKNKVGWLNKTLHYKFLNAYKNKKREEIKDSTYFRRGREFNDFLLEEVVINEINFLPTQFKDVIYKQVVQDKTLEEISNELNLNIGTCKTKLRRGKEILRERLYVNGSDPGGTVRANM